MTTAEVEQIVKQTLENVGISISKVVRIKPVMTTSEVCDYLGETRKSIYRKKEQLKGIRKNSRGDYVFDTAAVVNYFISKEK
jgi:hypothetical protein